MEGDMMSCDPEYDEDYCDEWPPDPLDDDLDQDNPCEYSEGYDWDEHDWDNDPDWY
jgi:hypothetical protein